LIRAPIVLFIGSDFFRKGLDVLVASLNLLKTPVHLSVAGVTREQFNHQFPELLLRIENSVHSIQFHGQTPRQLTKALLWHAHLFCLPSRSEALGVAILEALAAGLSCVATTVGGIPEIAKQCGGCVLIPPSDSNELATAIEKVINQPSLVSQSGLNKSPFNVSVMTQSLKNLYLK
jgi:glycosyltransferase involved in cell wall biosynthesis